jgi:hypothetical protein
MTLKETKIEPLQKMTKIIIINKSRGQEGERKRTLVSKAAYARRIHDFY